MLSERMDETVNECVHEEALMESTGKQKDGVQLTRADWLPSSCSPHPSLPGEDLPGPAPPPAMSLLPADRGQGACPFPPSRLLPLQLRGPGPGPPAEGA